MNTHNAKISKMIAVPARSMSYTARFCLIFLACATLPAGAVEWSWSGYGTLGYAQSDRGYTFERFTNDNGTLKRDSIFGLQLNADFNPQWGVTLQTTLAPSVSDDNTSELTLPWAFVSWRPENEWLLRAGKMRMPMYLYSENLSVGASYEFMHLPTEVYSTAPTNDFTGLAFTRTWPAASGEWSLDAFWGHTRLPISDGQSGQTSDLRTRSGGLMLNLRRNDDTYRIGVQQAYIEVPSGGVAQLPGGGSVPSGGGGGQPAPQDGGNPANAQSTQPAQPSEIDTQVYLLGADVALGHDLRLVGELARRRARNLVTPKNSVGMYASLQKKIGPWRPYLTLARLMTDAEARQNSSDYDDQTSLALGSAYVLSPGSRIKAEWMRVHIGGATSLVRTTGGQTAVSNQDLQILSLSYSFAF